MRWGALSDVPVGDPRAHALAEQWPVYAAYVVSFLTIGNVGLIRALRRGATAGESLRRRPTRSTYDPIGQTDPDGGPFNGGEDDAM